MYRKHLKMARGEGEQAEGIRSHFVERVVKLPIVHSAWDYAANTYTHIKESNKLVNFTLTNAERSVTFVAGQAKPVVMKFEKQIQVVDSLACKGLGTLEEKVPFITKPADEIITDTTTTVYSRLEGLKKYGNDKVKSIADYSLQKANAILGKEIVDSLLVTVDGALVITETYLDRFLPPTEEEKKNKKEDAGKSELSRLVDIPNKIFRRSYKTVVLRFEYAQEWAVELLIYPLTIVETYKAYAENALQYLVQFWESLKKEHTTGKEDGDKSDISIALSIVTDRMLQLIGIIRVIPQLLPMYIYGFASWLENKKNKPDDAGKESDGVRENGTAKHYSTDHSGNSSNHRGEES